MALAITPRDELGDLPVFARLQVEVRDRTSARTGPHSVTPFLAPEGGPKNKFYIRIIKIIL